MRRKTLFFYQIGVGWGIMGVPKIRKNLERYINKKIKLNLRRRSKTSETSEAPTIKHQKKLKRENFSQVFLFLNNFLFAY
jgi:hypothetical protein